MAGTPGLAQWGVAGVLLVALGVGVKWLMGRLESSENAREALVQQVITQVVPAISAATAAMNANGEATKELLDIARTMRTERDREREARIRYEERSRTQEPL